ncbi:MAG TPA: hypothetical protein VH721_06715, partial [Gaiellaceae bacterium]
MTAVDSPIPSASSLTESQAALSHELRRLTRVATFIAILSSPSVFYWFHHHEGWATWKALLATFGVCVAFRGIVDILIRRVIPWPSLFGTDDKRLREEDIVNRRRAWTWGFWLRVARFFIILITVVWIFQYIGRDPGESVTWWGTAQMMIEKLGALFSTPTFWIQFAFVFFLFIANFLIFMGPLLLMGISQIRGYEPGDAEWGVKLDDVRGQ